MTHFLTSSAHHLRRLLLNREAAVGSFQLSALPDGEWSARLSEDVRREPVTVVGSVLADPSTLFEILALCRLLRENKARNPQLVIPYLGYARQDRASAPGEGALGIMVAELVRNVNPAGLHVIDVHSAAILRALGPGAREVSALPLFAERLRSGSPVDVIVAADENARARANSLAALFDPVPAVGVIRKVRARVSAASAKGIDVDVSGKRCVIVDDLVDTGATMIEAARLLRHDGADQIRAVATHGLLSGDARERLAKSPIEELMVTNSLPQARHASIRVLDVTPLILAA